MKILIPLAGRASRFKEAGNLLPKPLIKLINEPMISWATKNLPKKYSDLIFFVLQNDIDENKIDLELKKIFSEKITIIPVSKVTEGAPLTLLLARKIIDTDEDILIWNGDQYCDVDVEKMILELSQKYDGLIPVFHSTLTRFSYVKVDSDMDVFETAEKIPISDLATVGIYYFRHGNDFVRAVDSMVEKDMRRGNEFFVCPTYNELLKENKKIKAVFVEHVWPLGTPEDVEHFKKYYR